MENNTKPRIYAHCPAGCKWETVHKSDFEQSATYTPIYPNEDGSFDLKIGVEYKIFAPKKNANKFDCTIKLLENPATGGSPLELEIGEADEYADSFIFRLLDLNSRGFMVYEIAGVRITEDELFDAAWYRNYATVFGATRVYRYNADASIVVENLSDEVLEKLGDLEAVFDELHNYAQALAGGGTV